MPVIHVYTFEGKKPSSKRERSSQVLQAMVGSKWT